MGGGRRSAVRKEGLVGLDRGRKKIRNEEINHKNTKCDSELDVVCRAPMSVDSTGRLTG